MTRRQRLLAGGGAAILVLLVGAGGGAYWLRHRSDPLARGEALAEKGDLRGAQVELRNALREQPNSADAHLRMARLQMKLADPVAADKEFRAAAARGADRWEVVSQLGEAMIGQGLYRETLAQVPARGPTPDITAKNLVLRAIAQIALKDVPAAEATLAAARQAAPDSLETALITARVAAARDDMAGTVATIETILARDPRQIDALLMKEQLLTAKGDRAAALQMADRAVTAAPWSAMARIRRAAQLVFAGQDAKAQADVDSVLEIQPRFNDAIYMNGVLMARRGKFEEASIELGKLDSAYQRVPQALYYEALVASRLGQTQSAAEFARRYAQLVPADPDGRRILAETELAANRPAAALSALTRAIADGQTDAETIDLLGRTQVALGRLAEAADSFTRASGLAPGDAGILAHLGLAQMQLGNPSDAAATLERAFALAPDMRAAGEALVSAALGVGDLVRANAALEKLRAATGETERVGVLTGLVRLRQNELEAARIALSNTVRTYPASTPARLTLARVLVLQGRRAAGLAGMAEILAKDPANPNRAGRLPPLLAEDRAYAQSIAALEAARQAEPKQMAFTAMLADVFTRSGDPQRALALLGPLRDQPGMQAPAARALLAAGKVEQAKDTYREALAATPTDLVARGSLVDLLVQQRDLDGAKAALRDGIAALPGNFRLMASLTAMEVPTSGLDAALRTADALRQDPRNMPMAGLLKGDLLTKARRPEDAAEAYRAEFDAAPNPQLLLRMAAAYAAAGQDDAAAGPLRAWLRDHPDAAEPAQALAQLDIKAKRYDQAIAHLGVVLRRYPWNGVALNNLAWVYHRVRDPRARATAQAAYLQAPAADTADTLAWIMVQEGAPKPAIPILERFTAQRPQDLAMRYHLAAAYNADGRTQDAATLLRSTLAAPQPFEERPEAEALLAALK